MSKPNVINDEWGTWEVYEDGVKLLMEPSQKWLDEHPVPEPTPDDPEPTPAPTVWDELAEAYQEGVNSIDE